MYKTKLQELCQRNKWELPVYGTTRQGPPHNSRFSSTVTVAELTFTPEQPSRTAKDSQNEAAHLAFQHFTNSPASGSSSSAAVEQSTNQTPQVNAAPPAVEVANTLTIMPSMYKNMLQSYTQKKNLALPCYSCEREGPPHASRFRCKVTVEETTYECPTFFSTLKEAENGAAKVALMSLPGETTQEVDSALYKNLLQELAQKEYHVLPIYETNQSGESHVPTFVSTVELNGGFYTGEEAKTKKQAEISAAKVAYLTLIGNSRQDNGPAIPPIDHHSSRQDIQPTIPMNPNSLEEDSEGNEDADAEIIRIFPQPKENSLLKGESSASVVPPGDLSSASPTSQVSQFAPENLSFSHHNADDETDFNSPAKIRILPYTPNMKLPEGCVVLKQDERFVALRM